MNLAQKFLQHSFPVYYSSRRKNRIQNFKDKCNKMSNFQDLPDEVILKILSYSETKVLLICGQVSKRIRRISHDRSLWVTVDLVEKVVKTDLLEMI